VSESTQGPGTEDDADSSPAVAGKRPVEVATMAIVFAFAMLMAWDNRRTGIGWESTGPQAGYFPFYVSMILAAACLYGLVTELIKRGADEPFVRRAQLKRVLQVFVPTLLYVPATQWLGIYVSSFLLITGFMIVVGKLRPWVTIVTGLAFSIAMFVTFDVAFDVIMPKGPLEHLLGY
jgi:hypothetical protein